MILFSTSATDEDLEKLKLPYLSRPCPLVAEDGAVIDKKGKILLIHRSDNDKWAMPGGLLETGETPAEGVIREILEETGIQCKPTGLIGVFDSRFWGITYPLQIYSFTFLCNPIDNTKINPPKHTHESNNLQWFEKELLPKNIDPGHITRIPIAFKYWEGEKLAYFDIRDS